ncbi:unnamed protein product [Thelazia callipaeda]|uniref:Uncharacterized protein n=1 Tax=Thelazia callipaeda TaxID=103827 RepID=A0A3P7KBB4_THECL|nr:unnamed protein product [Thelazia callipaeda]
MCRTEHYVRFVLKLSHRLLTCLDDQNRKSALKINKHPSVTHLVARRELGLQQNHCSFGRNALRALILSVSFVFHFIAMGMVIAHKARRVYNVDIMEPLCSLNMLQQSERILSTLWVELVVDLQDGVSRSSPYWILILTQRRLLCIDPLHQTLEAEFILPSELCSFSSLSPNELGRTFCLMGHVMQSQSGSNDSSGADSVVGLFDVYPLKFNGLFRVSKEVFGNVTNVSVISDMVIIFKKRPYETVLYTLADFQNHTEQGVYGRAVHIDRKIILPQPTLIVSEPAMFARISGNWSTLEFSGLPYHLLGVPYSSKGSYMLVDAATMVQPAALPFSLQPSKNISLQIEGASLMFHSDESGRILRFEGPALVAYKMQRAVSGEMAFEEAWRTNLWVDNNSFRERRVCMSNMKSSFGRLIKPTGGYEQNFQLVIKGVDIDIDSQIIAVITECDLNSPVFDNPDRASERRRNVRNMYLEEAKSCAVIFLLDDMTGVILKIAMMHEPVRENTIFHYDMSGVLMCFNQRGPRKSYLEVQRLQEIGVFDWENASSDQVCKRDLDNVLAEQSNSDNHTNEQNQRRTRLQTRNARSQEANNRAALSRYDGSPNRRLGRTNDAIPSGSHDIIIRNPLDRGTRVLHMEDSDSSDSDYFPRD